MVETSSSQACILVVPRGPGGVIGVQTLLNESQEEEPLSPSSSGHLGPRAKFWAESQNGHTMMVLMLYRLK